jgi:RNA polymerase sigma-70 factor (ECF subfamily)
MTTNRQEGVNREASQTPSDRSLVRRFREGSEDAATALYLRYASRLRGLVQDRFSAELARRLDPEDIVQSVFRRFFDKVRRSDYDVPEGEELWRLLLVIALNKLRNEEEFHRARKRDVRRTAGPGPAVEEQAGDDETALRLLQLTIDEALGQLSTQHRTMVELRLQGNEVADIALQTGRSKRSVERCLQAIRARFHTLLQE